MIDRPHHPDPCEHRIPAAFGDEDQRLSGGLPVRLIEFGRWKELDVEGRLFEA
jgi:hypothetical protein